MLHTIRVGFATAMMLSVIVACTSAQSSGDVNKDIEELKKRQATLEKQLAELRRTVRRLDPSAPPEGLKLTLGTHVKGSPTAPVTIVEFSDYQ